MLASQPSPWQTRHKEKSNEEVQQMDEETLAQEPPGFERRNLDQRRLKVISERLAPAGQQPKRKQFISFESSSDAANDSTREGRRSKQNTRSSFNEDQGHQAARSTTSPKIMNNTSSSDSCEKLAKEALKIGQAL